MSGGISTPSTITIAMNRSSIASLLAVFGLILSTSTGSLLAQNDAPAPQGGQGGRQGRGNFDPEQMRQRMMERFREQLGVKDDGEWSLIEARIKKINESRMGRGFGGPWGGPGGPGGGPGGQGGQGGRQGRGGFGQPNPDAEALQTALDSGASADDIKAKLATYRASAKQKEAQLEKAQDELRQLLSVKQEARAVLLGLLK
jgi:hypothetical protein